MPSITPSGGYSLQFLPLRRGRRRANSEGTAASRASTPALGAGTWGLPHVRQARRTAGSRDSLVQGHPIKLAVRAMGRIAPSALRFLAHHYPFSRGRYAMLCALTDDAKCRGWLASLENPTRTRRGFRIFTLPGDLTSDWIKLYGQHETGTEKFMLDHLKPGSTFLDIGANIGYFSLLAAVTGGARVVSFEPQRTVADLLQQSVAPHRIGDSARVERRALSNAPATMRMTSCPGNTGHSRLADNDDKRSEEHTSE